VTVSINSKFTGLVEKPQPTGELNCGFAWGLVRQQFASIHTQLLM
jgi:hypothetical protein